MTRPFSNRWAIRESPARPERRRLRPSSTWSGVGRRSPTDLRRSYSGQTMTGARPASSMICGARDVRLAIVDPGLTALPWEFVYSTRSDQRFLTVSQGMRRFYRTLDGPMPAALPLAWLRRALASLVDSGLRDDEPDGLRLRQAILSFQEREGLAEMGAADALTRWALDRSLRDSGGEPARLAIIVTLGDTSWYHPSPPQLLARLYQESDFDTLIVSDGVLSFELLKSELQGRRLAVIHVAAELNEAPSLGVHFNAAKDWRPSSRPDDGLITIRSLDAFLKSLPETELKPVVILSAILPSIRFEAVRQVFLRNAFAAELFRHGNASVVLATALGEGEPLRTRLGNSLGPVRQAPDPDPSFAAASAAATKTLITSLAAGEPVGCSRRASPRARKARHERTVPSDHARLPRHRPLRPRPRVAYARSGFRGFPSTFEPECHHRVPHHPRRPRRHRQVPRPDPPAFRVC